VSRVVHNVAMSMSVPGAVREVGMGFLSAARFGVDVGFCSRRLSRVTGTSHMRTVAAEVKSQRAASETVVSHLPQELTDV